MMIAVAVTAVVMGLQRAMSFLMDVRFPYFL